MHNESIDSYDIDIPDHHKERWLYARQSNYNTLVTWQTIVEDIIEKKAKKLQGVEFGFIMKEVENNYLHKRSMDEVAKPTLHSFPALEVNYKTDKTNGYIRVNAGLHYHDLPSYPDTNKVILPNKVVRKRKSTLFKVRKWIKLLEKTGKKGGKR